MNHGLPSGPAVIEVAEVFGGSGYSVIDCAFNGENPISMISPTQRPFRDRRDRIPLFVGYPRSDSPICRRLALHRGCADVGSTRVRRSCSATASHTKCRVDHNLGVDHIYYSILVQVTGDRHFP